MAKTMYCLACGKWTDTADQHYPGKVLTMSTCRTPGCVLRNVTMTDVTLAKPGAIEKLESDWKFKAIYNPLTGKRI